MRREACFVKKPEIVQIDDAVLLPARAVSLTEGETFILSPDRFTKPPLHSRLWSDWVFFDYEFWLTRIIDGVMVRVEDEPAQDFYYDCVVSKVCWRNLWCGSSGAVLAAFLRRYSEGFLLENSTPMPAPSDEFVARTGADGVVGYFVSPKAVFFFFWRLDTESGIIEKDYHVGGENLTEELEYADYERECDRSALRVFRGDFERQVEREIWGVRDCERAFGQHGQ